MKYEYTTLRMSAHDLIINEARLNAKAKQGWRLKSVAPQVTTDLETGRVGTAVHIAYLEREK